MRGSLPLGGLAALAQEGTTETRDPWVVVVTGGGSATSALAWMLGKLHPCQLDHQTLRRGTLAGRLPAGTPLISRCF